MRRFAVLLAVLCLPAALAAGPADGAGCPNEALRAGPSALLPACRAYEMVSPVDKDGGNVNSVFSVRSAPSGEAVLFYSSAAFAGAKASTLGNAYVARRGSNWSTESVDAPQENTGQLLLSGSPVSSPDLDQTLQASQMALTPGAIQGGSNVYLRDNLTGARTLLSASEGLTVFNNVTGATGGFFAAGSADWRTILVHTQQQLTPDAPAGLENLYLLGSGGPQLVNKELPAGEGTGANTVTRTPYSHAVSADGSRVFFQTGTFGTGFIYMREDGARTVPISAYQPGTPQEGQMASGQLEIASADGSLVYFTSRSNLTPTAETSGTEALYLRDVETGETVDLTPSVGGVGPEVQQVLAAAEDGSYVYFTARAALAAGATPAPFGATNIYAWHDGTTKWIAQTAEGNQEFGGPIESEASPNGHYLALASYSPLNGEDVSSPNCPTESTYSNIEGDCLDVYLFDYEAGTLHCASCDGPGDGPSNLGGQQNHETGFGDEFPRAVLDDGAVFMETPNRLLPQDVNGIDDVYEWREGVRSLISTGTGEQPARFGDATPDGKNVFFLTNQALVKQDVDASVDLYDAREDGGLAAQWPPGEPSQCEGDGCRGAAPEAPAVMSPGSVAAGGEGAPLCAGNPRAARAAKRRAAALERKARRLTRRHARRARATAKRLRGKASRERRDAKRLNTEATRCRRTSR
ncbi:MAG TPA: hypothetical protein VHA80_01625 [Solirubrobacterales bacterium]|nr:hypothetical protein [Solirubrobacterales bacterium]